MDLLSQYRPRHEATIVTCRGRSRWVCLCGRQMKGWTTDPQEMMRTYAVHSGMVEIRK